ncbi:hypothetical protein LGW89_08230, partial [Streptococcus mutans]|nr:hypothetical protein [Streptococcus mutans]
DMQKEDEFTLGVGGGGIGLVKLMDFGLAKKLRNKFYRYRCKIPKILKFWVFCTYIYKII